MNYRNYKGKIVEKYGIALTGWPTDIPQVCNPSAVGGRPLLEKLVRALESGRCQWVSLTDDELDARKKENHAREKHGEMVYRPRKSTVQCQRRTEKSSKTVDDGDETDDRSGDGDRDEGDKGDGDGDGDGDSNGNSDDKDGGSWSGSDMDVD